MVDGVVYCQDHVPVPVYTAPPAGSPTAGAPNPYAHPVGAPVAPSAASPVLAFILGWIPGVGAIYNGQYLKGLVHAIIFGLLVSIISQSEGPAQPLLGITMAAFVFYMPFEAYHTAKKRQLGLPVEEWSSLTSGNRFTSRAPIGAILLIVIGVLFLLDTLHVIEFREVGRFWPVILIVVGVIMLYGRMTGLRSHLKDQGYTQPPPSNPTGDAALGVSREH